MPTPQHYRVAKRHLSGVFCGMTTVEVTLLRFDVGARMRSACGDTVEIVAVVPVCQHGREACRLEMTDDQRRTHDRTRNHAYRWAASHQYSGEVALRYAATYADRHHSLPTTEQPSHSEYFPRWVAEPTSGVGQVERR